MSNRTVEATAPVAAGGNDPGASNHSAVDLLHLLFEGQRPLAGGARISLRGIQQVHLGRSDSFSVTREQHTLRIGLPDDRTSSKHATLSRAGDVWTLTDEGSRNGTFLGADRVQSTSLARGARFSLGGCLFLVAHGTVSPEESWTLGGSLAGRREGLASLVPEVAQDLGKLAKIAASDLSVLLLGASGTGKEVLARSTHALSPRASAPFVAVNCGALTASLLEAQLFGHVKGAFSGAVRDELGYFRAAHGGTLFLDEIGDLPEASQSVLLRVLETREVVPVGTTRPIKVDVRIIAATLRPMSSLREDLRMRLSGYTHRLAPMRERMPDLGLLIAELLPRVTANASRLRFSPEAVRALGEHTFPLNVRELLQALSSSVILAGEPGIIRGGDLPAELLAGPEAKPHAVAAAGEAVVQSKARPVVPADERKETLLALLAETQGNLSEVARRMNTTRVQVHRWIEKFEVDLDTFRAPGTQ